MPSSALFYYLLVVSGNECSGDGLVNGGSFDADAGDFVGVLAADLETADFYFDAVLVLLKDADAVILFAIGDDDFRILPLDVGCKIKFEFLIFSVVISLLDPGGAGSSGDGDLSCYFSVGLFFVLPDAGDRICVSTAGFVIFDGEGQIIIIFLIDLYAVACTLVILN